MNLSEQALRDEICRWGESMFNRGLTSGASGNLSARIADGFLVTPTDSCLGFLEPARLTKLDADGNPISGDAPTKEVSLHLNFYRARPGAGGVVHVHSTYATLISCLDDIDPADAIPSITPYVVMRVGRVPVLPYFPPGSAEAARSIGEIALHHRALLLANHGPVVSASSFRGAVFALEELEEAAKLATISRGLPVRHLSPAAVEELNALYGSRY